jgi:FMN reductase
VTSAVVVGNPRPASRTLAAATHVARELTGGEPDLVVDLATLGHGLLDWQDPVVAGLVAEVAAADLVVFASPTYKATYTGLLKLFLDRFAADSLTGVAVPLMLGAGPTHALAPELTLRPVLAEIGGATVRGHYVLDSRWDDPSAYADWLARVRPLVARAEVPA